MVSSRLLLTGGILAAAAIIGAVQIHGQNRGSSEPLPPALLSCEALASAIRPLAANDARLRDWANVNRYRQANSTIETPPEVVFMGDSITDAWPQPRNNFFPGRNYIGRGISGQTTPQMLIRMRPDVVAHKPRAVVILAGTNDIAGNTGPMTNDEITGNIASMAEIATANGIKVILASILPTSNYHRNPNQAASQLELRPLARIRAINAWLQQFASDHGHVYLDYYSAMIDNQGMLRADLSGDDLHPNAAGYAIMAPLAQAAIDRALAN